MNLLVQAFTINLDKGFVASAYDMYNCTLQAESDEVNFNELLKFRFEVLSHG